VRSGLTFGLSARQRFHDAGPARTCCRCSSFATVGRPFVQIICVRQGEFEDSSGPVGLPVRSVGPPRVLLEVAVKVHHAVWERPPLTRTTA